MTWRGRQPRRRALAATSATAATHSPSPSSSWPWWQSRARPALEGRYHAVACLQVSGCPWASQDWVTGGSKASFRSMAMPAGRPSGSKRGPWRRRTHVQNTMPRPACRYKFVAGWQLSGRNLATFPYPAALQGASRSMKSRSKKSSSADLLHGRAAPALQEDNDIGIHLVAQPPPQSLAA